MKDHVETELSKLLKYLTKNHFSNVNSLLEHQEENMK